MGVWYCSHSDTGNHNLNDVLAYNNLHFYYFSAEGHRQKSLDSFLSVTNGSDRECLHPIQKIWIRYFSQVLLPMHHVECHQWVIL